MSNFSELHQKAVDLPFRLSQSRANNSYATWSSIFCACLPALSSNTRVDDDANLLRLSARALNKHPTFTKDEKYLALLGMYIYVWQRYDTLNQLTNSGFLGILSQQLNVASLKEIENSHGMRSLNALDNFCQWVGQQKDTLVEELYKAFPVDILAQIYDQRQRYLNPAEPSWMSFTW